MSPCDAALDQNTMQLRAWELFSKLISMRIGVRNLILLGLLLILPIQGMATALGQVLCDVSEHHSAQAHSHAQHDHGTPHDHESDGTTTGQDHAGHLCCHHFSAAAPNSLDSAPNTDLPVFQSALSLLWTLFIPEQPQRPPRG